MTTNCTRCDGSGFLNVDQFPDDIVDKDAEEKLEWLVDHREGREDRCCSCHIDPPCSFCVEANDIEVCDCCGDGKDWYGTPGGHYGPDDPQGDQGPYASNGGLCRCH